jgi:serine/threonine protein kinase
VCWTEHQRRSKKVVVFRGRLDTDFARRALGASSMALPFEERYECLERIGKGSFGVVFRGRDVQTGEIVAIKVIDLEQAEDEIEDIQQEISVMAQCNSPHVTKYYASYVVGTKLYLVMEYVGGGSVLVRAEGWQRRSASVPRACSFPCVSLGPFHSRPLTLLVPSVNAGLAGHRRT